jgi:N-acetylneuraminic acid mutarotase
LPADRPSAPPWTDIASYPEAIMDNTAAENAGMVYSVGGYDGIDIIADAYVYDPGADAWSSIASMSVAREKPAAIFIDGLLYVVGGWDPFGNPSNVLEIYDPGTDTWTTGASAPQGWAASVAVNLNGQMYVIGGCDSINCGHTDVFRYDPASDTWDSAAPYPEPISWQHCGVIGGQIYCAGGVAAAESDNTYVYDPAADAWTQLADMLQTQWAGGYIAANGMLYVSGGVTANFATVTNQTFVYDPAADTWTEIEPSNNTVYRGASACGFYRIGGSTGGFSPVPNAELYPGLTDCGGGSGDIPWLSVEPISGTIPANGTVTVMVTLDARQVPDVGVYMADLRILNDSPYGTVTVPVQMTVTAPPTAVEVSEVSASSVPAAATWLWLLPLALLAAGVVAWRLRLARRR